MIETEAKSKGVESCKRSWLEQRGVTLEAAQVAVLGSCTCWSALLPSYTCFTCIFVNKAMTTKTPKVSSAFFHPRKQNSLVEAGCISYGFYSVLAMCLLKEMFLSGKF